MMQSSIASPWTIITLMVLGLTTPLFADEKNQDWRYYLGDLGSSQSAALQQIHRDNVTQLEQVWLYESEGKEQIQCNPLIIDGVLYGISAKRSVFALNAATGTERWTFKPEKGKGSPGVVRGLQYWEQKKDKRIYVVLGSYLYALHAETGTPIDSFGTSGHINLRDAYDRDLERLHLASSTPGVIYKDKIIVSVRVAEAHPAVPGDIMAFNIHTGAREWVFHTIPRPGEFGYDSWSPDAWQRTGGANCWAGMALDEKRGMVFIPTGAATFDFFGGDRKGDNLFANTLLALDAATGKRIWNYQIVHHDLWDRDIPAPPNLLTVQHQGKQVDAVAQITKSGHVFLFNRDTGEPLFPIDERPVPPSPVAGEHASKTQPTPRKPAPFARQHFTEAMVTQRTESAHTAMLERYRRTRTGDPYTPPSQDGTIIFPGFDGGGEWGGAAVDPESAVLYVNSSEMPWILTLFEIPKTAEEGNNNFGRFVYAQNCVYCHGPDMMGNPIQEFPPLIDIKNKYTPEQMKAILKTGKERMPAFDFLNERQVDAVVNFVYELDATNAVAITEPETSIADEDRWYTSTGYNRFLDDGGYPAVQPPWGTLNAIDMNTGEYKWKVTLGENPELDDPTYRHGGTENYGGPLVTAGGLVFIAATKDQLIRAFDKDTGEELWRAPLPAAGFATPATYSIDGRQYIVIAAAGGKIGMEAGNAYVAFALPQD